MGEDVEIADAVFYVEIGDAAGLDGIGEGDVGVNLHTFLRVVAHLLILSATFVQVSSPFHGLDEGGEFDDLGAQRAVKDPAGTDGNLTGPTLRTGENDFYANVTSADAGERSHIVEEIRAARSSRKAMPPYLRTLRS